MGRAMTYRQIVTKKRKVMRFGDEWRAFVGNPEKAGSWLIWGGSGSGKTRFCLQVAKMLTEHGTVAYNSLEEGDCESFKLALMQVGFDKVKNIVFLEEGIKELQERLLKPKSPDIVIIDSLQYTGLNYTQYKQMRADHPRKLFILISHGEGAQPGGRVAKSVRFDCFVKIFVKGYKAFSVSRYGGGEPYIIWKAGADRFWGDENDNILTKNNNHEQ